MSQMTPRSLFNSIRDYTGFLVGISRFRFWIYTGGTYVIGYTLAAKGFTDFLSPAYYIYLLYFFSRLTCSSTVSTTTGMRIQTDSTPKRVQGSTC